MRESSLAAARARSRLTLMPASVARSPWAPPSMHPTPRVAADMHATPSATTPDPGPAASTRAASAGHPATGAVLLIMTLGAIVLASVVLTASLAITGG